MNVYTNQSNKSPLKKEEIRYLLYSTELISYLIIYMYVCIYIYIYTHTHTYSAHFSSTHYFYSQLLHKS